MKSFLLALWHRPEIIISTGGLLSLPVCLGARLAGTPIELYELNVEPGKAIKALMPFASTIYMTFPQTRALCKIGFADFSYKCIDTQYPLRFGNIDFDKQIIIDRINAHLRKQDVPYLFCQSRTTIFILGGSQGSKLLNALIKQYLDNPETDIKNVQIIHQTGSFEENSWNGWYASKQIPAFTFGYDERIHEYYALANVVICRAGAGTLFEIAHFNKPCIVIPLVASTTDHQVNNAYAMVERYPGIFRVLEQKMIDDDYSVFSETLRKLLL